MSTVIGTLSTTENDDELQLRCQVRGGTPPHVIEFWTSGAWVRARRATTSTREICERVATSTVAERGLVVRTYGTGERYWSPRQQLTTADVPVVRASVSVIRWAADDEFSPVLVLLNLTPNRAAAALQPEPAPAAAAASTDVPLDSASTSAAEAEVATAAAPEAAAAAAEAAPAPAPDAAAVASAAAEAVAVELASRAVAAALSHAALVSGSAGSSPALLTRAASAPALVATHVGRAIAAVPPRAAAAGGARRAAAASHAPRVLRGRGAEAAQPRDDATGPAVVASLPSPECARAVRAPA